MPPPPPLPPLPHPLNERPTTEREHIASNFAIRFIPDPFVPFVSIEFMPQNLFGVQRPVNECASPRRGCKRFHSDADESSLPAVSCRFPDPIHFMPSIAPKSIDLSVAHSAHGDPHLVRNRNNLLKQRPLRIIRTPWPIYDRADNRVIWD